MFPDASPIREVSGAHFSNPATQLPKSSVPAMFLEIGPASLVIQGTKSGSPWQCEEKRVVEKVKLIMAQIADLLPVLKQRAYRITNTRYMPYVPKMMVEAVKSVDESTLTPMAAVAGAVADALKEFLNHEGIETLSVNNGGDISVFNSTDRTLTIDIGDIRNSKGPQRMLSVRGLTDYGVATSGLGGRSLTLGLADTVTVVAPTAALADAAATFVCNHTNTMSDKVRRIRAVEVDPLTDIPDEMVTIQVNQLTREDRNKALQNGLTVASNLQKSRLIYGSVIVLQGDMVTTINGDYPIILEV